MNAKRRIRSCRALVLAAVLLSAGVVLADDNPFSLSTAGGAGRNARLMTTDGKVIYEHVCQSCHMADGRGAKLGPAAYPALATNAKLVAKMYPAMLIVNGLGAMPAFGSMMNDEQVAAVVNYVRASFGNTYTDTLLQTEVAAVRPARQRAPTELRGR